MEDGGSNDFSKVGKILDKMHWHASKDSEGNLISM